MTYNNAYVICKLIELSMLMISIDPRQIDFILFKMIQLLNGTEIYNVIAYCTHGYQYQTHKTISCDLTIENNHIPKENYN